MTSIPDGAIAKATEFLAAWKARDWDAMLKCCQKTWVSKGDRAERIEALEDLFGGYSLIHYQVKAEPKEVPSEMAFKLRLCTQIRRRPGSVKRDPPTECMVIRESAPYMPSPEGDWGVNPLSVWHR